MKQTFLFFALAFMALFTSAQNAPVLLEADIDTVNNVTTADIIGNATNFTPGTGDFYLEFEYKESDSIVWHVGDSSLRNSNEQYLTQALHFLKANTWYDVRHKAYNLSRTDSSYTTPQTVRTKQVPQPLSISFVDTLSASPKSGIIFSGSAVGHLNAFAFGVNTMTLAAETDTIFHYTGGIDTVHFLVDGPGAPHQRVRMVLRGDSGMIKFATTPSPPFSSPGNAGGNLAFDSVSKSVTTANVALRVTSLGNVTGGSVLITKITNSFGVIVLDTTQQVLTTGPVTIPVLNLRSNTSHTGSSRLVNGLGQSDTVTYSFTTKNVQPPVINALADATLYFDRYKVNVYSNSYGTYDSSAIKKLYIYEGANSMLIDSIDTLIIGTGINAFIETGKMHGTTYTVKVQGKNAANLLSNMVTLTVQTKTYSTNNPPTVQDLITDGSSKLKITGLVYHIGIGNIADCAYLIKDISNNTPSDTVITAHGATQDISFQMLTATNLIGGHAYSVTPITIGANGIVAGNTLVQVMPSPELYPIAAGITKVTSTSPTTMLDVKVFGNGEGNPCTVIVHLDSANVQDVSPIQQAPGFHTGDIDMAFSWSNRTPNTEYKVRLEVVADNGNAATTYEYFRTDAVTPTGVKEIVEDEELTITSPIAEDQPVRIINAAGQVVAEGEYQNVRQQVRGMGVMLVELLDKNSNPKPLKDGKDTVYAQRRSFM